MDYCTIVICVGRRCETRETEESAQAPGVKLLFSVDIEMEPAQTKSFSVLSQIRSDSNIAKAKGKVLVRRWMVPILMADHEPCLEDLLNNVPFKFVINCGSAHKEDIFRPI